MENKMLNNSLRTDLEMSWQDELQAQIEKEQKEENAFISEIEKYITKPVYDGIQTLEHWYKSRSCPVRGMTDKDAYEAARLWDISYEMSQDLISWGLWTK